VAVKVVPTRVLARAVQQPSVPYWIVTRCLHYTDSMLTWQVILQPTSCGNRQALD
jgi:hypothetical protein